MDGTILATRKLIKCYFFFQLWNEFENALFRSFGIGGDGNIYEGRGFNVVGAHAPNYNNKSIGICLIGNWESESIRKFYHITVR